MEVRITDGVRERLRSAVENGTGARGCLVGWRTGDEALTCTGLIAHFDEPDDDQPHWMMPIGMRVIGSFNVKRQQNLDALIKGEEVHLKRTLVRWGRYAADAFDSKISPLKLYGGGHQQYFGMIVTWAEEDDDLKCHVCSFVDGNVTNTCSSLVKVKVVEMATILSEMTILRVRGNLPATEVVDSKDVYGEVDQAVTPLDVLRSCGCIFVLLVLWLVMGCSQVTFLAAGLAYCLLAVVVTWLWLHVFDDLDGNSRGGLVTLLSQKVWKGCQVLAESGHVDLKKIVEKYHKVCKRQVSLEGLEYIVSLPATAFHVTDSKVVLRNLDKEFHTTVTGLTEDMPCTRLAEFVEHVDFSDVSDLTVVDDDGFGIPYEKQSKAKADVDPSDFSEATDYSIVEGVSSDTACESKIRKPVFPEAINVKVVFQKTGVTALKEYYHSGLKCKFYKSGYKEASFIHQLHTKCPLLPIDFIVMIPNTTPVGCLHLILTKGIRYQLEALQRHLNVYYNYKTKPKPDVQVCHFKPLNCDHFITTLYPSYASSDYELEKWQKKMQKWFMLSEGHLQFKPINEYVFPKDRITDSYLISPHAGLPPSGVEGGALNLVSQKYMYYHCMQDGFNDEGWGAPYRCVQTIFSSYGGGEVTFQPTPCHSEIQQVLVDGKKKPWSFIGSKAPLSVADAAFCLEKLLGCVECKTLKIEFGAEMENVGRKMSRGTRLFAPILIIEEVSSRVYLIVGLHSSEHCGQTKYLVLDPNYTGPDDRQLVQNQGWCEWKGLDFWDTPSAYSLCIPSDYARSEEAVKIMS